uniref:Uncharacterized protein n=1 Tax=Chaetoceros debilis TaxID=122233 RepID=A0A7S3V3X7_9STRA|mmetsp:Transcript_39/g.86  ORF Transcript_39/g.86 Transcript_39/m.86 type:complete len:234 (+) Transcript_39:90-791(+)
MDVEELRLHYALLQSRKNDARVAAKERAFRASPSGAQRRLYEEGLISTHMKKKNIENEYGHNEGRKLMTIRTPYTSPLNGRNISPSPTQTRLYQLGVMKMTNQRKQEESIKHENETMANNTNRRPNSAMRVGRRRSTSRSKSAIKSRNSDTIDRLYAQGVAKIRSAREQEETRKHQKAQDEGRDVTPSHNHSRSRSTCRDDRDVSRTRQRFSSHNTNYAPPRNPRKVIMYRKE